VTQLFGYSAASVELNKTLSVSISDKWLCYMFVG